jgi:hypothetical protein
LLARSPRTAGSHLSMIRQLIDHHIAPRLSYLHTSQRPKFEFPTVKESFTETTW